MPGWNEPVATGTRSPIFNEAFWPSEARICGWLISLLSLSLYKKFAVAAGMVTWKFVALRCARLFRLRLPVVPVVAVPPVPALPFTVVVVVVVLFACNCTLTLVGGLMPRDRKSVV